MEKVQKKTTWTIKENIPIRKGKKALGGFSAYKKKQSLREGITVVDNFMTCVEEVYREVVLQYCHNATPVQFFGNRLKTDKRNNIFSRSAINLWNLLPQDVMNATQMVLKEIRFFMELG